MRALLARHGIPVVVDAPGVGENLPDHLQIRLGFEYTRPITTNDQLNSWFGQMKLGLQWPLYRSGPLAAAINQGGCIMRALPLEAKTLDIQFTELDRRTAVAGLKAARAIAASDAMRPYVLREVKPGPAAPTDAELLEFCRNNGATIFHPTGTCRMGIAPSAVVDSRLRVNGVAGLRAIDCSVMPTLVSGNTNAPVVMMAEKAADMIREDAAGNC